LVLALALETRATSKRDSFLAGYLGKTNPDNEERDASLHSIVYAVIIFAKQDCQVMIQLFHIVK